MPTDSRIDSRHCTDKLRIDYAHAGLYDVISGRLWIARKRLGVEPSRVSHARLLVGGSQTSSTAEKDQFICYSYHPANTGFGMVQGRTIEWREGHIIVRLDPLWDHRNRELLTRHHPARVEQNIEQQFAWGKRIFAAYLALLPKYPVTWHMVAPSPADSTFAVERVAPVAAK